MLVVLGAGRFLNRRVADVHHPQRGDLIRDVEGFPDGVHKRRNRVDADPDRAQSQPDRGDEHVFHGGGTILLPERAPGGVIGAFRAAQYNDGRRGIMVGEGEFAAHLFQHLRLGDHDELPGLAVDGAGCGHAGLQEQRDGFRIERLVGEFADAAAAEDGFEGWVHNSMRAGRYTILWNGHDVAGRAGCGTGTIISCPDTLFREDAGIDLRAVFLNHVGGQAVLLADLGIQVRGWTFAARLGVLIQFPQAEALGPAAFPFEVIHQRPVEVTLDRPVEVDRAPHLVDVLRKVARAQAVLPVFHAILGDEDGQVELQGPFETLEEAFRDVGDEAIVAQIGALAGNNGG